MVIGTTIPGLEGRVTLTVPEAAQLLGVEKATIYRQLAEIPHLRIGKRIVIPTKRLLAWVNGEAT